MDSPTVLRMNIEAVSTLDQRFQQTIAATHGAVQAAYVKRKEHAEAIADDLSRFEAAAAKLAQLCAEIEK